MEKVFTKVKSFVVKESVLCIAVLCALVSTIVAGSTPSEVVSYIKWETLCVLASLIFVVAAFKDMGLFAIAARKLTNPGGANGKTRDIRFITLTLVLLPYFSAMLITNDVALLTFVPLGILMLAGVGREDLTIRMVILQAAAANMGSMITPFGNPHNLECYIQYDIPVDKFFASTLAYMPICLIILITGALVFVGKGASGEVTGAKEELPKLDMRMVSVYSVLTVIALLTVFGVIENFWITIGVIMVVTLVVRPKLFAKVDWLLLLTFMSFFIFSGNLVSIDKFRTFVEGLTNKSVFLTAAICSQAISNIPTTFILENITDNWKELMLGADVGGLGTPIASLANLIAIKEYMRSPNSKSGKFMGVFLILEFVMFGIVLLYSKVIGVF